MSVLLVDHDMHLVMTVYDRIVVIDFGRKVVEETRMQSDSAAIGGYLGTDIVEVHIVTTHR